MRPYRPPPQNPVNIISPLHHITHVFGGLVSGERRDIHHRYHMLVHFMEASTTWHKMWVRANVFSNLINATDGGSSWISGITRDKADSYSAEVKASFKDIGSFLIPKS